MKIIGWNEKIPQGTGQKAGFFHRFFVIELVRSAMSAQMIFGFIYNIICVDNYLYS